MDKKKHARVEQKTKKAGQVKWYHFTSCPLTRRGWLCLFAYGSTLKDMGAQCCALCEAKKDAPRPSGCPRRGQRQGRKISPRSQRRKATTRSDAKRSRPKSEACLDRMSERSTVASRRAGTGGYPPGEVEEKKDFDFIEFFFDILFCISSFLI